MEDTGRRIICCDNNLVLQIKGQKNERGVLLFGYRSSRTITDKQVMSIKTAAQGFSHPLPAPRKENASRLWSQRLYTLLNLTDINNEENKEMYNAPFHGAVMSPCWPFNWKYLDGVLPATAMHHSLMACQEKAWCFLLVHIFYRHIGRLWES